MEARKAGLERHKSVSPVVGPSMKPCEALDFIVTVIQIDPERLETSGQPSDVADLSHMAGVCYELCRFIQCGRDTYPALVAKFTRDPALLNEELTELRKLIEKIVNREDYACPLEEGSMIEVYAPRLKPKPTVALPFSFVSQSFRQQLVVVAVFYLGLTPKLAALIGRCHQPDCRKLYVATRASRLYCSHECASKASMAAYVQRQQAQTKPKPRRPYRKISARAAVPSPTAVG